MSPSEDRFGERCAIICTGTSDQQIRSIGHELQKLGRDKDFPVLGTDGLQQGRWVIIDFVDVLVHLFDYEFRNFYDLELLWGDAPKLQWQRQ